MIKQTERKFTIVAISVISLVLLLLLILINTISIVGNIQRADATLNRLVDDPGYSSNERPPKGDKPGNQQEDIIKNDTKANDSMDNLEKPAVLFGDEFKEKRDTKKDFNRSFEVILGKDLSFVSSDVGKIDMFEDTVAYNMALLATKDNQKYGFIEGFRYLKTDTPEHIKVRFLDYSFERQSELNFLLVSVSAYFGTIILVTVLVILFLKPVMKPIRESYARQKQFITDASHELKTPLTIISTDMQLIEMENGPSNWSRSVNNQVERLNNLTNELVTLSRMNEEDIQIIMEPVNLTDLVNDVVIGFEPAIKAGGKALKIDIKDNVKVKGDYDSLERVMSILLSNALKYSDDQGMISVSLINKNKKVHLSVQNSVESIIKGNHNQFLQRFYRSDASRNSKTGGFGIGLAVAKSTVEAHRGTIEVNSFDEKSLEVMIVFKV